MVKKIFVFGDSGKMGRLLCELLDESQLYERITGPEKLNEADLVIDFSSPRFILSNLEKLVEEQIPLISGTTGFLESEFCEIKKASKEISILHSQNFSIGIYLIRKLIADTEVFLSDTAEIEIVEKHHRRKKDSPSGTALLLAETIAKKREKNLKEIAIFGRSGTNLTRKKEIAFHSLRGGNIVGDHSVQFILNNEIIEIRHEALSRKIFAEGAVACIQFLLNRKAGLYTLDDVYEKE